jgi:hypothetical protein
MTSIGAGTSTSTSTRARVFDDRLAGAELD